MAEAIYHYPRLFFYPQAILVLVSLVYTVNRLEFSMSRNDLVGGDKLYHQNFLKFRAEFPNQDDFVVVAESENMEKNRQFVERLGAYLEGETNLFTDVMFKGDLNMLGKKALLFLDEKTLQELRKTLVEFEPFIQKFATASNLPSLFKLINRQFSEGSQGQDADLKSLLKGLPAIQRIADQAGDCLTRPGTPPSPGINALFGAGKEAQNEMYITFQDGRIYLVTAHAKREELHSDAVERLRELVQQVQREVPGINVGITGEPVLEYDEMAQSQKDTTLATIVSLILVGVIFIYGYQQLKRPIKATLCLMVGLIYTLGFTTLAVGHLNILTITFIPMLIGMGIDFGVHLVSRYEEELRRGHNQKEALTKALVFTGLGIYTGCFTTASAFLAMGITDFKGIQEMGIISGGGLLICLVPMMILFPILLLREKPTAVAGQNFSRQVDFRARLEQLWLGHPGWTMVVVCALSYLALWRCSKVFFDYNLLNMQSAGLPAVITEKKLINSATNSVLYGAVVANSLSEAVAMERRLTNMNTVASVKSMHSFMTGNPSEKLQTIGEIKKLLAGFPMIQTDTNALDLEDLNLRLHALQGYLGLAVKEVQTIMKKENEKYWEQRLKSAFQKPSGTVPSNNAISAAGPAATNTSMAETTGTNSAPADLKSEELDIEKGLSGLRGAVVKLRDRLLLADPRLVESRLGAFQRALFADVRNTFQTLRTQDDSGPLKPADLPPALRNRFIGRTGKILLQVFPKFDVWQRENQRAFVEELRKVDSNVTGTPVQLFEYTTLLKDSYEQAAYYATGVIAFLVLAHFRSLTCVFLAMLPVGIGTLWMVGIMGWFEIPFNPANIMTLPLVVGVGVTSGIHILNRYLEEPSPEILAKSTGLAVIVSALTTVAGFGSLILAEHQGIRSLGLVMSIGTTTCMVAALVVLPALLNLLSEYGFNVMNVKPAAMSKPPERSTGT